MRRLTALPLGVLTAAALLAPALVGTASAASAAHRPKPVAASSAEPVKPGKHLTLVGVVAATPTVRTSATATSTVLLRVRRTEATAAVLVTPETVVKRDGGRRSRYELRLGDKVTVRARRVGGSLVATAVNASGRR